MKPQTPYVLIDGDILDNNIKKMAKAANELGCDLRPHIKTHKTVEISKMQVSSGAKGITVAKLGEAEVMVSGGMRDIFMAYPVVGYDKITRAIALHKRLDRLILAVDSYEGASSLSEIAQQHGVTLEVRMEVDTGLKRTGVPLSDAEELAQKICELEGLRLTGIYTFKGSTYKGASTTDRDLAGHEEGELLVALKEKIEHLGVVEVSGGSTPTGLSVAKVRGVTEIRPGTYVFNDAMQASMGVCGWDDCAVRVVYTVVSVPEAGRMVVDGGSKSISTDVAPNKKPYNFCGYGTCPDDVYAVLERLTEEHGMVTLFPGAKDYKVGDTIEFIPNHVCTTINLYDDVYIKSNGIIRKIDVAARGKLY